MLYPERVRTRGKAKKLGALTLANRRLSGQGIVKGSDQQSKKAPGLQINLAASVRLSTFSRGLKLRWAVRGGSTGCLVTGQGVSCAECRSLGFISVASTYSQIRRLAEWTRKIWLWF